MDSSERQAVSSTVPTPAGFLQPEAIRLYFPALEPWAGVVSLSVFIHHLWMWTHLFHWLLRPPPCCHHLTAACCLWLLSSYSDTTSSLPWLSVSTPLTHLNEYFFFKSLVVRLPYSLIFLAVLGIFSFAITCDPSYGYMRRCSMSTYASILTRKSALL